MQLTSIGRILRKSLWIIIVTTLVGGAVGYLLAVNQRPTYTASAKVLFSPSATGVGSTGDLIALNTVLTGRVQTYTALVNTPLILDPAIQDLGLSATAGQISSAVSATTTGGVNVVTVSASSSDPASAAALANAASASLADHVTSLEAASDAEITGPTLDATVVQTANPPGRPSSPDIVLMTGIGLAIGFAIGVLIAGLRAASDTRIRTRRDIEGATTEAIVVTGLKSGADGLVLATDPRGESAEAYRRFRALVRTHTETGETRRIIVTSPRQGADISTVAANLAAVIAEEGVAVCLVDADLRTGSVAGVLGVTSPKGLSDVLGRRAEIRDAVIATSVPGLAVFPAGEGAEAPYSLFSSSTMTLLMDELPAKADIIVIAAPPLLDSAESVVVSGYADEAVLVVQSGRSRKGDLTEAYGILAAGDIVVSGVLLADVPRRGVDADWR